MIRNARTSEHSATVSFCLFLLSEALSPANEMMAVPARLELATFGLGNRCSIRLSYGTGEAFPRAHHIAAGSAPSRLLEIFGRDASRLQAISWRRFSATPPNPDQTGAAQIGTRASGGAGESGSRTNGEIFWANS
jgi:hypothetical protein